MRMHNTYEATRSSCLTRNVLIAYRPHTRLRAPNRSIQSVGRVKLGNRGGCHVKSDISRIVHSRVSAIEERVDWVENIVIRISEQWIYEMFLKLIIYVLTDV